MKSNCLSLSFFLIFLLLFLMPEFTYAQKDSIKRDTIKKEYKENQAQSDFYLKRREKYDYLTRAKIEELSMFRVGLALTPSTYYVILGPSIGYEKKLSPDFSLIGSAAYGIPIFSGPYNTTVWNISIGGRYYYNMRERIWEGKSANNLSGNYFSIQLAEIIGSEDYNRDYPIIEGLYGIQRRLGHACFFDVNIGGALGSKLDLQPVLNFDIGFGF